MKLSKKEIEALNDGQSLVTELEGKLQLAKWHLNEVMNLIADRHRLTGEYEFNGKELIKKSHELQ